jgi:NADP-dependent 3-hydroxy acid dehydrogenase YdfG
VGCGSRSEPSSGSSPQAARDEILREYPYLEAEDIAEALSYAAWRAEEVEVSLRRDV